MTSGGSDDREDGKVLSPDELDVAKREEVEEIDEGRYVVSPSGKPRVDEETIEKQDWLREDEEDQPVDRPVDQPDSEPSTPATASSESPERSTSADPDGPENPAAASANAPVSSSGVESSSSGSAEAQIDAEDVSRWLARSFAAREETYCFDLSVDMDGDLARTRRATDDVSEALEELLVWYADRATDDIPPEEVIGILLASSDTEVRYPVQSVYAMLKRYGLRPDDSISDLLAAVRSDGNMTVPPSRDAE